MSAGAPIADKVVQKAAEWIVRLSDDDANASDHEAFLRWQAADPRHAEAVSGMRSLIGELESL
ncbi:MAG TPA: DUF4880 domain-containing protein, partial [Rhodocyclaceae bacterium]|nr:DUF4880 domain-containing protein [Rhodocyclaceae bacterium]